MFKIIGDDIELDSKVVARIVVPPSTLRDQTESLLEGAGDIEDMVERADHIKEVDESYEGGYADGIGDALTEVDNLLDMRTLSISAREALENLQETIKALKGT